MCIHPNLSPSYSYKKGCRCDRCNGWKCRSRSGENQLLAKEKTRLWRLANPERSKATVRAWQARNVDKYRDRTLQRKYGISLKQYKEMNEQQKGLCAICGQICKSKNMLSVDHDHKTGQVRQLLCSNCNTGLGKFYDDPKLLQHAIDYIQKFDNGDVYE